MASCKDQYLRLTQTYDTLEEEKQRNLLVLASKGDLQARQKLLLHNSRLALSIAKKYFKFSKKNPMVDVEDIFSASILGLAVAIARFKPKIGTRLSTYAYYWINQKVLALIKEEKIEYQELDWIVEGIGDVHKEGIDLVWEEKVAEALKRIPYRERKIIADYYFQDKLMKEIGKELNISIERVRQLKKRALKWLRQLV